MEHRANSIFKPFWDGAQITLQSLLLNLSQESDEKFQEKIRRNTSSRQYGCLFDYTITKSHVRLYVRLIMLFDYTITTGL